MLSELPIISWQDVALALVAGMPGIITAFMVHKNRVIQREDHERVIRAVNGGTGRVKKPPKKNGAHPDWYHPPDLS
jgi:hypothetical protein